MRTLFSQKVALVFFGLVLSLFVLEAGLRLASFGLAAWHEYQVNAALKVKADIRILCLGESTTREQYPRYLQEYLRNSQGIKFTVIDEGISGTNSNIIVSLLGKNIDKYKPDFVVTMIGVNDYGGHMPYTAASMTGVERFLDVFKTYKLMRLVWMHVTTRIKDDRMSLRHREGIFPGEYSKEVTDDALGPDHRDDTNQPQQVRGPDVLRKTSKDHIYVRLGDVLRDRGDYFGAEKMFRKAIEINPRNDLAYTKLGWLYWLHAVDKRFPNGVVDSRKAFERSLEINPEQSGVWMVLAGVYMHQDEYVLAEAAYKKYLKMSHREDSAFEMLGVFYFRRGDKVKAEETFKRAFELYPDNVRACSRLANLYCEMGRDDLCQEYTRKMKALPKSGYASMTLRNYQKIKKILSEKKIGWICVQYPTLSVALLKEVVGAGEGIVFVDMMGGTWGHCQDAGNRLLAGNIADAIKEKLGIRP
ncbi:MAG: tetratricopeptide repeat protein [Candidatus Omnitrophota bacterium]